MIKVLAYKLMVTYNLFGYNETGMVELKPADSSYPPASSEYSNKQGTDGNNSEETVRLLISEDEII